MSNLAPITYAQQRANIEQNLPDLEGLNDYLIQDPFKEASNAKFYENAWSVAEVVTKVAFTALALVGMFYIGLYSPEYIAYGLSGVIGVFFMSQSLLSFLQAKVERNKYERLVAEGVCKEVEKLQQLSDRNFTFQLYAATPNWNFSIRAESLLKMIDPNYSRAYMNLLARYKFWKKHTIDTKAAINDHLNNANQIRERMRNTPNMSPALRRENENNIMKMRDYAYQIEETELLKSKVVTAFMVHILQNPLKKVVPNNDSQRGSFHYEQIDVTSYGHIQGMNFTQRELLRQFEPAESEERNPYFVRADGTKVNRDVILQSNDYAALARTLFTTTEAPAQAAASA